MNTLTKTNRPLSRRENQKPLFTQSNYEAVKDVMKTMPQREQYIIHLRFWGNHSIDDIARITGLTWNRVDQILNQVFTHLRAILSENKNFRRSKENSTCNTNELSTKKFPWMPEAAWRSFQKCLKVFLATNQKREIPFSHLFTRQGASKNSCDKDVTRSSLKTIF